ncbi:hypothetical protein EXU18_11480 [Klebsiella pneumoniae]|uniref:DUF6236 family protein n=2 Tax=Klebsiella pneumoniae TaxID=573 RepID=UPI001036FE60|nr:DUF6236 family protein [Klebsiella pneumoniae]TBO67161.1 hypothetical protein EXT87_19830 [Klebsiella pneumoniae]TBO84402.1 hypothetical protein EXT98_06180 [Klebsiella pneumoniae]TBP53016.1 hypothetical protein EXU18_11480 [Klebsiella pneumoniae]HCB0272334.1 hypothetical protein [Klebsiella pneumoniae]HDZ2365544.1 hypothetical protein [Klebsiella pneumoniae]
MENHVLMFPDMFINADNNSVHIAQSNLNYRKLLINALYWDKIITTNNNLINISNNGTPGVPELKREGLFTEVMLPINGNGNFATILYEANMKFMLESLARKDINFIASEADKVLIKNSNEVAPDNGELFTLINAIPEPDESVNIHDVLEFRHKRQGELKNLMNKINELNIRVLKAENRDLELKAAINEIDTACAEVIRLYKESLIKFNLSKVKFNLSPLKIIAGAGGMYKGAKHFELPETAAIISGIVGGVFTAIDFSESFSLRRIDKTNPFNYVGEMSKKLN